MNMEICVGFTNTQVYFAKDMATNSTVAHVFHHTFGKIIKRSFHSYQTHTHTFKSVVSSIQHALTVMRWRIIYRFAANRIALAQGQNVVLNDTHRNIQPFTKCFFFVILQLTVK